MFRLHDNVPEVYMNESRDFQLISRIYDAAMAGVKFDVDSIVQTLDAMTARDRILDLMCTKIGFFPRVEIDANVLKYIIASFPYIIKNKGNKVGIQYAVNAILKAESNPDATGRPVIIINNNNDSGILQPYMIYIYTTISLYNRVALEELLRYAIPVGYSYQIAAYMSVGELDIQQFTQRDAATLYKTNPAYSSSVVSHRRLTTDDLYNERVHDLLNAFDMTEVLPQGKYLSSSDVANPVVVESTKSWSDEGE